VISPSQRPPPDNTPLQIIISSISIKLLCFFFYGSWDSSVGIAARYGLDAPMERASSYSSRPTLGPMQSPPKWVTVLFPRRKVTEAWRWSSTSI
jgi:hypothetical protein